MTWWLVTTRPVSPSVLMRNPEPLTGRNALARPWPVNSTLTKTVTALSWVRISAGSVPSLAMTSTG